MQKKTQNLKGNSVIFPSTKIKKFIRNNEKIGKIFSIAPSMIGRLLEIFLIDLLNEATVVMERKKSVKIKKKFMRLTTLINKKFKRFSLLF